MRRRVFLVPTVMALGYAFLYVPILTLIIYSFNNSRLVTVWDAANSPPYMHHGMCTTMRGSILAHGGEGLPARNAFMALPAADQDAIIEFLKTLQVLPPGTADRVVDENFKAKVWPPIPDNQL